MNPEISVILAVRNGEETIAKAMESLLSQTYQNMEIILIDDDSKDKTPEILSDYEKKNAFIRFFKNDGNIGLTKSLNKGLSVAKGKWIARQDADDVSYPNRFLKQTQFLRENPDYVAVGSWWNDYDLNLKKTDRMPPADPDELRWEMILKNPLMHASMMFQREVFTGTSLLPIRYDESYDCSQDYELWDRLLQFGKIGVIPEALCAMYRKADSISFSRKQRQNECALRVTKKQMERLGVLSLPSDEVLDYMRGWGVQLPEEFRREDVEPLICLLDLLKQFDLRSDGGSFKETLNAKFDHIQGALKRGRLKKTVFYPDLQQRVLEAFGVIKMRSLFHVGLN